MTRSNASSAAPPCAVGSVSGPATSSISITEPGQPCVTISGSAFSCRDLTWMKWISKPVDLGHELRERVQLRLARAPVVAGAPVGHQVLDRRQLYALRPIGNELFGRPAGGRDAPLQVGQVLVRHVDLERSDGEVGHGHAPSLPPAISRRFQAWRFLQRRVRNAARNSPENSCGCSQAAKWPPRSASLK